MPAPVENTVPLFNRRPLAVAALGFSMGIFLEDVAGTGGIWLLCLFCMLALLAFLFKCFGVLVFLAAVLLGMLRMHCFLAAPNAGRTFFSRLESALLPLRQRLIASTDALFPISASLFNAMLWGDKGGVSAVDRAAFEAVGIAHILALSGLHISFFVMALNALLPKRKPRLRFFGTGVFLLFYCAIAAFPASLVRASLMAQCVLGARLARRRSDLASALSFAALILLLFSPEALFSLGAQLSFAAVAGIALLYAPLLRRLSALPESLSQSMAVTLSATLGTLPLTAVNFLCLPVYALLANLLLLPFIPFAILPAFVAALLYPLAPRLAELPAFIAYHIMEIVRGLSQSMAVLPMALVYLPAPPSALCCALCYAAILLCSDFFLRNAACKRRLLLLLLPPILLTGYLSVFR